METHNGRREDRETERDRENDGGAELERSSDGFLLYPTSFFPFYLCTV